MKTLAMLRQILTWRRFAICQQAQDVIEYTLLLAFMTLGVIALISGLSDPVSNVWNTAGSHLEKAKEYAKGRDK